LNILSLDVGGTFIKWGVMNESVEILKQGKVVTPRTCLDDFLNSIKKIVELNQEFSIVGLSFSLPGTMDSSTGDITHGGSLRYLDGINFYDLLQNSFPMNIHVANDARCAALAEMQFGNLGNVKNGLAFILGTGVGGAIIINGEIYSGSNLYAGEFSLMVSSNLENGRRQFLGDELSVPSLVEKVKQQLNLEKLTGESMMEIVKSGNSEANKIYGEYINCVVNSLISLQFIFSPEKIVLGGGISQDDYFIESIIQNYAIFFKTIPLPKGLKHAEITRYRFANDANLIGAFINYQTKK